MDPLFAENPWFASVMDDYRELAAAELPADVRSGCTFTSVCINPMLYLPWLVGQCLARGVVFRRADLAHIADAATLTPGAGGSGRADVVVNATGLLACRLGGVRDPAVYPIRGQVVVVRNELGNMGPMVVLAGTDDAPDEMCYVMARPAGGGTVLGGTYQRGSWEAVPDPDVAVSIMQRAVRALPALTEGMGVEALSVVRHGVGLRPGRDGGVRLERERIRGTWVVHNYGHAGWGYQGSYGCAERVLELVDELLAEGERRRSCEYRGAVSCM